MTKKAFIPVVEFLQANQEATVADILPDVLALTAARNGAGGGSASTFVRDEEGNVVAIQCYYHKTWMDPRLVEFGKKASSPTGLNNMCKEGVSKWTKQQSAAKKAEAAILTQVQSGDLEVDQIAEEQARIAEERAIVVPHSEGLGFDSAEECIEYSAAQ